MIFIPGDITSPSVRARLNASIAQAKALRGSIAYWTIPPSFLDQNFVKLLNSGSSYCCVDLQRPTKIDQLGHFFALGAHQFHLHCRRLKTNGKYHSTNRLLHTKLLLFDFPNGEAEIWIGSHNFTGAALTGLNLEASIVVPSAPGTDLYEQVRTYLDHIRSKCHPFDPARIADYEALQGLPDDFTPVDDLHQVLDLITDDILSLPGKTVLLLGDDSNELARFKVAGTNSSHPSLVEVADRRTGHTRLIRVRVQSTGYVHGDNAASYGITFTPRPYAIRLGGLPAFINTREKEFGRAELRRFKFWVNLELLELLPESAYLLPPTPRPQRAKWVVDPVGTQQMYALAESLPLLVEEQQSALLISGKPEKQSRLPVIEEPDFLVNGSLGRERVLRGEDYSLTLEQELRSVSISDVQSFYEEWFQRPYFSPEAQRGSLALPAGATQVPERLQSLKRKLLRRQQLRLE
ncbi:phospholipase D-like domain-containing protein [Hymenobacter tenuis]